MDHLDHLILAGDVGGTKTHLGLFRVQGNHPVPVRDRIYHTRDYPSLEAVCLEFMRSGQEKIARACFGVPGPPIGGEARATNVPWVMRETDLSAAFGGVASRIINDLSAAAYGVIHLPDEKVAVLQRGKYPLNRGNIAIIAAGTGLGEGSLVFEEGRHYAVASEGGHSTFAPANDRQIELYQHLRKRLGGHVSVERVLSGPGLFNIYNFMRDSSGVPEPEGLRARLRLEDSSAVVSEMAMEGRDQVCVEALEMFVDIYGAEASSLALKVLALGGVYVAGGIAPKILPALRNERFLRAFNDKGRLAEVTSNIEVRVSLDEGTGLIGAAYCAASAL